MYIDNILPEGKIALLNLILYTFYSANEVT